MNLFILALSGYHIFLRDKIQITISNYLEVAIMLFAICMIITFIMGIFIRKFEITSEVMWFIFNGFEYDTVDLIEYFKLNTFKLLFYEGASALAILIVGKII